MRAILIVCLTAIPLGAEPPPVRLDSLRYDDVVKELKGMKGKVVLVDVWGTFCAPCKEKFPHVMALDEKYRGRGLAVVTVSVDPPDDPNSAKASLAFLQKQRATCRNVLLTDAAELWQEKWKIDGPPILFLFDRDGRLVAKWKDKIDLKEVEKQIEAELK
jgi:thiol-disulfide isomerase/thioredoxin